MTALLRGLHHRATHRAVTALSTRPALYFGLRTITGSLDEFCIRRDTELVIEGYPRSANSTTAYGFLERQERPVRVAHHKHHAAQLMRAVHWGIPAVALVREPRAAILSFLAFAEEARQRTGRGQRINALGFHDAGVAWFAFYRAVMPFADRLLVVPFERATSDLEGVIDDLNARFGTSFRSAPEELSPQGYLGWHALPTPERQAIKAALERDFAREVRESPRLRALIDDCSAVYERLAGPK